MEYHELGEIFEHDGVLLEVVPKPDIRKIFSCKVCYLGINNKCPGDNWGIEYCDCTQRKDNKCVIYKLVEQCKTKDMKDVDYHKVGERFEYEGVTLEVKEAVVDISVISCDLCYLRQICSEIRYLHQPPIRNCSPLSRKDRKSVYYVPVDEDYEHKTEQEETKEMEQKTDFIIEGTDKPFATQVTNIQSDEEIYGSLLDKLFTTYKAKNHDYSGAFTEMFDELGIDYAYGKLREKINRIKVLRKQPNMVENEGLEDALLDTAGYAILTLVELKKRKR